MFKQLFGQRATTKLDVIIGVVAAIMASAKAVDTVKQFKAEQADENEENQK